MGMNATTPSETVTEQLLEVNGRSVPYSEGGRVLGALREAGFDVPTLCYESRLEPQGTCRMCLVDVEVDGRIEQVASCTAFQQPNMKVTTHSDSLKEYRRTILDMLLSETGPQAECPKCISSNKCDFHSATDEYGADAGWLNPITPREKALDPNPFIQRDYDFCIGCFRCTIVCNDWEMAGAITVDGRSQKSKIFSFFDNELLKSPCTFCGQCINTCPTGALTNKKIVGTTIAEKLERTKTICPYCGVGCGIELLTQDGELKGSEPDFSAPSQGSLCVKGQFGTWDFVKSADRLTTPLIRKDGELQPASWDEAISLVASKFQHYKETDGPDSLVLWASARVTSESNYLMQKFARVAVGTNNIDNCSRT